jgi:hypothetical protein
MACQEGFIVAVMLILKKIPLKRLQTLYLISLFLISLMVYLLARYLTVPSGLEGKYYANPNWQGEPQWVTVDSEISTAVLNKRRRAFSENKFSVEWKGFIWIEKPGSYTFMTASDDGSDLFVNNRRVVDNGGLHGLKKVKGQIHLEPGVYPVYIRYFQAGGFYRMDVFWALGDQPLEKIPSSVLSPYPFNNRDYKLRQGFHQGKEFLKGSWFVTLLYLIGPTLFKRISRYKGFFLSYSFNLLFIFLVVFISYFKSEVITSFDSQWSIPTAMSLIKEGNANLDEYHELISRYDYYVIQVFDDHFYTMYPIGVSLIAVPFVFVLDQVLARLISFNLEDYVKHTVPVGIELFIASFIVALTAVGIYLIARLFLNPVLSLLPVFIFAFCTSAWSTASRALWQHGPSMLMLTLTLYLILLARSKSRLIPFTGIPLAFSYVIRPTDSLSVFLFTIFIFLEYRSYFLPYLFWAMAIGIPFLWFNLSVYHSFLPFYYLLPQKLGSNTHFLEALAANLISPARGIFIFSPILLFSIYGVVLKIKKKQFKRLDGFLLSILILHGLSISFLSPSRNWWAGHSFGPRLFSDVLPYFIYFLIPAVEHISQLKGLRKLILASIFLCFMIVSFLIHYRGANDWEVYRWNQEPVNVDLHPERIWDWRDIQFLRGITG